MSKLTGVLYGCLIVFLGGWFLGEWSGNFSALLLMLTLVTMVYWLLERFHFAPKRVATVATLAVQADARRRQLADQGITRVDEDFGPARAARLAQPWWLDWTAGLFPVILAVFLGPYAWIVASSFKPQAEIFRDLRPISWATFIPLHPTLENFIHLFVNRGVGRALINSAIVSASSLSVR